MKTIIFKFLAILFIVFAFKNNANAQFEINGQLVQRGEYRNGFGKLIPNNVDASGFISQRFRIQSNYKSKNVQFFGSIQDIRTWGNTSQTNISDGFLSLHEGWADITIDSFWSVKLGRQELNYDNARFLGNLDWALQARSHDFALVKFTKNDHKLHFGGGYNQDAETINGGDYYKTINQYKMAQMLWYNYKHKDFECSFLVWNNGKQDTTTGQKDVRFSQTIGLPTFKYSFTKNNIISGFAYYQTGKDVYNKDLNAYDISLQSAQTFNMNEAKKTSFKVTLGAEMLSGTNTNNTSKTNSSFSPMYGTNHAHNGYMDYFFVGGRFENNVGLNDLFLKLRYDNNKKWFVQTDVHSFSANANVYKGTELQSNQLGTEIDLSGGVVLNDDVSFQVGYSQMLASSTLKYMQTLTAAEIQNWMYVMLIIRPKSDKKFIGLLN
jgi:hypothetical protein